MHSKSLIFTTFVYLVASNIIPVESSTIEDQSIGSVKELVRRFNQPETNNKGIQTKPRAPAAPVEDSSAKSSDSIEARAFKLVSDLNDLMEQIEQSKALMFKQEVYYDRYLDLVVQMKQKLENTPQSLPVHYRAFLTKHSRDCEQMRHCGDLIRSVLELEKSGITSETSIMEWDRTIMKILELSPQTNRIYKCPPSVEPFLQDKNRCAKSDLRGNFVNQALDLVRSKDQQEIKKARSTILSTINRCRKANVPVPAWFQKL